MPAGRAASLTPCKTRTLLYFVTLNILPRWCFLSIKSGMIQAQWARRSRMRALRQRGRDAQHGAAAASEPRSELHARTCRQRAATFSCFFRRSDQSQSSEQKRGERKRGWIRLEAPPQGEEGEFLKNERGIDRGRWPQSISRVNVGKTYNAILTRARKISTESKRFLHHTLHETMRKRGCRPIVKFQVKLIIHFFEKASVLIEKPRSR